MIFHISYSDLVFIRMYFLGSSYQCCEINGAGFVSSFNFMSVKDTGSKVEWLSQVHLISWGGAKTSLAFRFSDSLFFSVMGNVRLYPLSVFKKLSYPRKGRWTWSVCKLIVPSYYLIEVWVLKALSAPTSIFKNIYCERSFGGVFKLSSRETLKDTGLYYGLTVLFACHLFETKGLDQSTPHEVCH